MHERVLTKRSQTFCYNDDHLAKSPRHLFIGQTKPETEKRRRKNGRFGCVEERVWENFGFLSRETKSVHSRFPEHTRLIYTPTPLAIPSYLTRSNPNLYGFVWKFFFVRHKEKKKRLSSDSFLTRTCVCVSKSPVNANTVSTPIAAKQNRCSFFIRMKSEAKPVETPV